MEMIIVMPTVEDVCIPKLSVRETCSPCDVTITRSAPAQSEQGGKKVSKAPERKSVRAALRSSDDIYNRKGVALMRSRFLFSLL